MAKLKDLGIADVEAQPALASLIIHRESGSEITHQSALFNATLTLRGWDLAKMRVFRAVCKYGPPLGLRRKLIGMISAVLALGIIPGTFATMFVVAVVGASALTIWHYGPSLYAWWVKVPQDVATAINMHQKGALRGYF